MSIDFSKVLFTNQCINVFVDVQADIDIFWNPAEAVQNCTD